MNFTFNTTVPPSYSIQDTCQIIAQYILILKGERVNVLIPTTEQQIKLFELAATYAIPAYESGWKLKQQ